MPSVFISYSHDSADPTHADRVAGLAASLLRDGLKVFFDQNRGDEEEGLPWPIWMDDKIQEADYVLLVCTELYWKKVRQKVPEDEGRGVCWEANIIYVLLYEKKMNTTKFLPVLFSPADRRFIPTPLGGRDCFMVDSQSGYKRLYAFLTRQHRIHFPEPGSTLPTIAQKTIEPLFETLDKAATSVRTGSASGPDKPIPTPNPQLTLKPDAPPAPRQDVRGLDWYDECDAGHFIGRDSDANDMLARLVSHPILRLVGPSGIGKSSLIRAGLLPKIREFGWRACVIRPFENPAQRVPPQLTAQLLTSPGAFTTPLDTAKFRADVAPLLSSNGIKRLVLFLDQFEDIVSPMAAPGAVDAMREFLGELWEQKEAKPYLRAVVVYRTDADARLGQLWQEISGRPEGLPYVALQGLSRSVTENIINQTAREQGWRLETSVPEIARQLALESQNLDRSGEVFPVYLQIFLKQAEQNPEGRITTEFITSLGGVSGLIGKYLEQTLERLKARGGEWQQCGAVLESLSRSGGAKVAQSLNDLVRETGLSRAVLAEMLPVLINERLVRPVGHEIYEIQHDRLAAAVIESMKDSERDAKAAREFLAAKVPVFERTMVSLTPGELVYLYRHRRKIHPTERELRLLLASILHNIEAGTRNESPGGYWFGESSPQDFLRWFIQIEHWAAEEHSSLRPSHAWAETFPLCGLESEFAALAADPIPSIRAICARWIGRTKRDEGLRLLRKLVKDQNSDVRLAAAVALARFAKEKDLPLLRKLAKDSDSGVRAAVVKALASFLKEENLLLLRQLAKDSDPGVCAAAAVALASFLREEDLPLLRQLAKGSATLALARFAKEEDLPLLRQLANGSAAAEVALASFAKEEVVLKLRKVAPELYSKLGGYTPARAVEVNALANILQEQDLPLLRQLAGNSEAGVRVTAAAAMARFGKEEVMPLLRKLATETYGVMWGNVQLNAAAVKALASFLKEEDLPLLRKLAKDKDRYMRRPDQDRYVRVEAVKALASFAQAEDLPRLRELATDQDRYVRVEAVKALARFSMQLPLLRELAFATATDDNVAAEAVHSLTSFCSREELEDFLNQHEQELCAGALAALDEVLYMPEWLKPKDREQDR